MKAISLSELIAARIAAKRAEDEAVQARRDIDAQLAELLKDAQKPEGAISQKVDGYKLTVTYKLDRKVDAEELTKSWDKLPIDVQTAFKWKPELSVSEFRKLEDKAANSAARFFTTKEASPSIKIEAV
jgi:hypothetical protein